MKKLFFFIALLMPFMANAQFELTPEGFKAETGKDFYVVEIDGTQAELFSKAKTAITQVFVSAKDVASYNEPEVISLQGFTDKIKLKTGPLKYSLDTNYTIKILFKDGKIRFNAPDVLNMTYRDKNKSMSVYMGTGGGGGITDLGHVFKKDGKIRHKEVKETLEEYFNGLINAIVDKIKSPSVEEDW